MKKAFLYSVFSLVLFSSFYTDSSNIDVHELKALAVQKEAEAGSREDVVEIIRLFESILKTDSNDYFALTKAGNYKSLLGAAYTDSKKEKKVLYLESRRLLEKALKTNGGYTKAIEEGKSFIDAVDFLSEKEVDAMGYWFTVNFYYYKECLNVFGKIKQVDLIERCNEMIDRVEELDSTWSGGGVYFSRAIYYIAMPEKYGGSKDEAKKCFENALTIAPDMICNRWGRAKYLFSLTGDQKQFEDDLNWVIQQFDKEGGDDYLPMAWNAHFVEDAKRMLAEM